MCFCCCISLAPLFNCLFVFLGFFVVGWDSYVAGFFTRDVVEIVPDFSGHSDKNREMRALFKKDKSLITQRPY